MSDMMDILKADPGRKVVFLNPSAGYRPDREWAAEHLELGAVYEIIEVKSRHYDTRIRLKEVPDVWFNSVQFVDF